MDDLDKLSPDQLKTLCRTLQKSLDLAFAAGDELIDRMKASKTLPEPDRATVATWWRAVVELHDSTQAAKAEIVRAPEPGAKLN